ncbi:hypothetical protein D3C71_1326820 [compost metagenome]
MPRTRNNNGIRQIRVAPAPAPAPARATTTEAVNQLQLEMYQRLVSEHLSDFQTTQQIGSQSESPWRIAESVPDADVDFMERPEIDDDPFSNTDEEMGVKEEKAPFSSPSLPLWESRNDMDVAANKYVSQLDYRLRWIFYRQEREGVTRRQIPPFNREDFYEKKGKAMSPHLMDSDTNHFYDWNIGSTDFIMRIEMSTEYPEWMRCHFIYKPTMLELCYADRRWDGDFFSEHGVPVWAKVVD